MELKTKQPCQTPGCNHPNWHLCPLDKSKPDRFPELLRRLNLKAPVTMDASQRAAIAETQRERWAEIRRQQKPVDDKMVARYAEGDSSAKMISKEFGVGVDRVLRVLREAQDRGEITIRKPGSNVVSRKGMKRTRKVRES